jgi:hypothetical protein
MRYVLGETVRAVVNFVDSAGAPVEASGVTGTVKNPAGTVAEAMLLAAGDGSQYVDIPATVAGQ